MIFGIVLKMATAVGVLSDSSSDSGSDSSSDSSDSDSDSDLENARIPTSQSNTELTALNNDGHGGHLSMPSHLLSEDLQLSDSGSESD